MNTRCYVLARSQDERGGIYGYGDGPEQVFFEPLLGASYAAFSPDGGKFYTVFKEGETNRTAAYRVRGDGSLEFLDRRETRGASSCHLTTDSAGNFLYCANYLTGDFIEFRLRDGLYQDAGRLIALTGEPGPNPVRQDHAHTHCTVFTPDGQYLCVVDLGLDEVQLFAFDPDRGIADTPSFRYRSVNPGAGPRHILFAPDGRSAWLVNEVDSTVSVLAYRSGTLTHRTTLPTLPENFTGGNTAAALRLSPDGRYLCVSNRGHDSFACYRVDAGGGLALHAIIPSHGRGPRDVNFLPGGEFVCCNEQSGTATFFRYEAAAGSFRRLNREFALPGPLCVLPRPGRPLLPS